MTDSNKIFRSIDFVMRFRIIMIEQLDKVNAENNTVEMRLLVLTFKATYREMAVILSDREKVHGRFVTSRHAW